MPVSDLKKMWVLFNIRMQWIFIPMDWNLFSSISDFITVSVHS